MQGIDQRVLLTALGIKYLVVGLPLKDNRNYRVNCLSIGKSKIDEIENHTEVDKITKIIRVNFIYGVTEIPDWAWGDDVIGAFSALSALAKRKEQIIYFEKSRAHAVAKTVAGNPLLFRKKLDMRETAKGWLDLEEYERQF